MVTWADVAGGIGSVEHAIDPAMSAVPPGTVTGPGQAAPTIAPTQAGVFGHLGQLASDLGHGFSQEGLMGLLDPVGMMDRQEAQRELRGNFDIIDPAHPPAGPLAGNQVSEADFEKTARLYSDIRLDRTHMHMDTSDLSAADGDQYRRDAMGNIGRILQTGTGRELVDGIAHNPLDHDVTMQTHRTGGAIDNTNANAEPRSGEHDASTKGVGSDVDLFINPAMGNQPMGQPGDAWSDSRSDVWMFHEMTHTYHQLRGQDDASGIATEPGLGGSTRDADNADVQRWEHQAVGLGKHEHDTTPNENAYRRERAEIGKHGGATVLPGDVGMAQRQSYD